MHKQGDILLVPIPFSDLSSNKKRPVLVISNTPYNTLTEDIVVCAITSNLSDKGYTVRFDNSNMKEGNLKFESCIRADKVYTVSKGIIIKKFACIDKLKLQEVKDMISELLSE